MNKQNKLEKARLSMHLRDHSLTVLNTFSSKIVMLIKDDKLKEFLEVRRNMEKIL